jgi:hypothetical protein
MNPIEYVPKYLTEVQGLPEVPTAWKGLEKIIPDIIQRFHLNTELAVEFGVFYGYSTAALASNFKKVVGIDTFQGDAMAGVDPYMLGKTRAALAPWQNIELVQSTWEEFASKAVPQADMIHIDIFHTYNDTYCCGLWAMDYAPCILFHDTQSYPEVMRAVTDLAEISGRAFYNYPHCYGLGILVNL